MTFLDPSDYDDFRDRLLPGENIAWTGRPQGGLLLTSRDFFLIPFSLLWGGFAIFWEATALSIPTKASGNVHTNAPDFFPLFGIPFVLIGLYFIFGRFFVDAWIRSQLRYAATNQRILILRKGMGSKFTALALDKLPALTFSEKVSGRGTIRFGEAAPMWGNRGGFSGWTPSSDATPQFINIPDARRVFDQIQSLSSSKTRTFS
ncbi:MAG TPA: hypothetical protein VGH02_03925 [Rhizomicrobium sp.]|jgi:hypothetical protein